ncbi:hypothetical protein ACVWU4_000921 [Campylobacter coli]
MHSPSDMQLIVYDIYQDIKNIRTEDIGSEFKVELLENIKSLYLSFNNENSISIRTLIEKVIKMLVTVSQINVRYKNIYPSTLNKRLMFYIKSLAAYTRNRIAA